MEHPRRRRTAGIVAVVVVALVAFGAAFALTGPVRRYETARRPAGPPLSGAAAAVTASPSAPASGGAGAALTPAVVAAAVTGPAGASGLGSRLLAEVDDAATGQVLWSRSPTTTAAPASTAKILTATAVLSVHHVDDRITTRAELAADGTLTVVGAGDPTLSAAPAGQAPEYAGAARLSDLAAAVRAQHRTVSRIVLDDSAFSGPSVSPDWVAEDVPSSYGAGITALMADGGRAAPGDVVRSATPDLAAGRSLAGLLGRPALPVTRGPAPAGSRVVASVRSAPFGVLIEQMLHESDNVIAECLGRLVAVATHRPATFTGGAAAIRAVLARTGADVGGGMLDASGLAADDRLAPRSVVRVVRLAAGTAHPQLRAVLAALPVSAWSGTLAQRYTDGAAASAAGVVRAKTGTLTGVATLAGVVHARSGRLLAFSLVADRTGPTPDAEAALDDLVARLAAL